MFVFLRGGSTTTIRDTDVSKSLIAASDEAVNQPFSSHPRATLRYVNKEIGRLLN